MYLKVLDEAISWISDNKLYIIGNLQPFVVVDYPSWVHYTTVISVMVEIRFLLLGHAGK